MMSLAFSPELLCGEDSRSFAGDAPEPPPYVAEEVEFPADSEESMAGFVESERVHSPGSDYPARFRSLSLDASARDGAVSWILKVQACYGFRPLTAYLSVNYMDRFLASHRLPEANGWPLQLLSVACVSLAAKMEETMVPSLLDLQVEGARFIFEPRTIRRMELLLLTALNWRLRSVTPFTFVDFFAHKIGGDGCLRYLVSRASQIVLLTILEIEFLNYCPSAVAAAAVVCAADGVRDLPFITPVIATSWCVGLTEESISSCYQLMQELVLETKAPRVSPMIYRVVPNNGFIESGSSSTSSSTSSPSNKRRKLNNFSWASDDQEEG
ncbi:Cyclin-D1-1 [Acorus gramineus]|uniref:Cyclin-D1-1 n=1 Tax=Acorus gramineus TaxID=55184 RepID=A0AAV9B824_ACOGR|nr:Cyclin-D1-1 [Acorus gramineus]